MAEPSATPVALVTGSSRGIGLAAARALAADGMQLVVNCRHEGDQLDRAVKELADVSGLAPLALAFDVGDPSAVKAAFRTVQQTFGRLDVLVVNAGILGDALVGMIPDDLPEAVLRINVAGAIHTLQAGARVMMRRRAGSIIMVSSIVGRRGNVGQVVYAASKAAVIGATLAAARELGPSGIRVNAIAPGMIETDMIRHLSEQVVSERVARTALGRLGAAEEVADLVRYLAGDGSRYITGQVIGVDGGLVL